MFLCPDLLGFFSSFTSTFTMMINVIRSLGRAYICYHVVQYAGNHKVDSLVNYLGSTLPRMYCMHPFTFSSLPPTLPCFFINL